jgi:hypothetical protein
MRKYRNTWMLSIADDHQRADDKNHVFDGVVFHLIPSYNPALCHAGLVHVFVHVCILTLNARS